MRHSLDLRARWARATPLLLALLVGCDGSPVVQPGRMGPTMMVVCDAPRRACGSVCTDVASDNANCGACGSACPTGLVCTSGSCQARCLDGQQLCAGRCINPTTDNANCGACGNACASGQVCAMGRCDLSCGAMLAMCGGGLDGGAGGTGRFCTDTRTDPRNCGACGTTCPAGNTCVNGMCTVACVASQTLCEGTCRDLQTDVRNCGACGNACPSGQVCSMGACQASCGADLTNCGGSCVSTATDPRHCGACGMGCDLPNSMVNACVSGRCVVGACNAGFGDCDGMAANGCETDVRGADANNCGACGSVCRFANASATCAMGVCAMGTCNAGFADCDMNPSNGCEVNVNTDNANCARCGAACASGQVCSAGACGATCGAGTTNCAGDCVNTQIDPNNCGMCGTRCALPNASVNVCASGRCAVGGCNAGFADCDGMPGNGCETNLRGTDASNCGACGVACRLPNAASTCAMGACVMGACADGFADCDGLATNGCEVNLNTDNAHCGRCPAACAGGQVCAMGACATSCGGTATNCGGDCVNTLTDPNHCGGCGMRCDLPNASVNACVAGRCVLGGCRAGFADCDGMAASGCETDVRGTDVGNCGGCGIVCRFANAAATCAAGACAMGACNTGFADCDMNPANGCEVNLNTDNTSCGRCGTTCAAGRVCAGGTCAASCGAGTTNCAGDCVNTATDPANCGACGTRCALPNVSVNACASGACVATSCNSGFADCDGVASNGCETAVRGTDTNNCGGCGIVCRFANASATCTAGTCAMGTCNAGFADCDLSPANGCEVNLNTDNASCGRCGSACTAGRVCASGTCSASCGGSTTNCAGDCVNTATDPANCGACGTRCALANVSVNVCAAGRCAVGGCNAGFADCDMNPANGCEVNVRGTDVNNCGACGTVCRFANASAACVAGVCAVMSCNAGFANCDGMAANGCEVNLNTDNGNCGRCSATGAPASCAAGQVCAGGSCTTSCGSGLTSCSGGCTSTSFDPNNCGACGTRCALANVATQVCAAGTCVIGTCASGFVDCDRSATNGCEVNTSVNSDNCGACGRACPSGATCTAGSCTCPLGTVSCGGACVSLTSDPTNCGSCGRACPSGQVCVAGSCAPSCASGTTLCSGACVLLGSDVNNCGRCGNVCASESTCAAGVCTPILGTSAIGCADGAREGFTDATRFPNIAACAGGWTVPGIFPAPSHTTVTACATNGDDSTASPNGTGCSSADLCAPGWHLCRGGEIASRAAGGCASTTFTASSFFAAAVSGTGCGVCALLSGTVTTGCNSSNCISNCREDSTLNNDFFGCGNIGSPIAATSCDGLDRFSSNNCSALPSPWTCSGFVEESLTVTKPSSAAGGVLCCR